MKRLLMLGGGIMQIPALRIAKSRGWKVYLADGNEKAMGRDMADVFLHIDLRDREGLLEAARRIKREEGLDGVFTAGTDFSTSVAYVAENLGLPGIDYSVALSATDKSLMRQKFRLHEVPSPRYTSLEKGEDIESVMEKLSFPLVVKPVDNMGARGVRRVDNKEELERAVENALKASRVGRAIIEEYMEGAELSYDAIVYRGEITICGIADRHIRFSPYFVEMGHTMPSDLPEDTLREATKVFKQGIKALGIDNGAAKGDIKITDKGPMIGEIAARLSGGYMSGWTFPYSSGVDVTGAALNISVGLPPGDMEPKFNLVSAERAFISIPGRVARVEGVEEAKSEARIRDVFLRIGKGDKVTFPANNVEKCGNVISVAESKNLAVHAAMSAVRKIRIYLETCNSDTDNFLFGSERDDYFSRIWAFRLKDRANMDFYKGLWWHLEPKEVSLDRKDRKSIAIVKMPHVSGEKERDWHGEGFEDALSNFRRWLRAKFPQVKFADINEAENLKQSGYVVLGRLFWKAFLKGGLQGGIYIVESVDKLIHSEREITDYFRKSLLEGESIQ